MAVVRAGAPDQLAPASFDDIVYFGADADRIEVLGTLLAPRGVIDIVLGGGRIGRPVAVDVGRVHYDLTRWVGTTGDSAADGYAGIPADGELRAGDREAVIGAAGPMGFMHVVRAATSGLAGLEVVSIDIDDARLAHLADVAGPLAAERGVTASFLNSRTTTPEPGFSYVAVMVPAPALVVQALDLAGAGARVNLFAGFAVGTLAALDLDTLLAKGAYLFGTSGSEIPDMKAVLAKLERGDLDTNVSLDAVTGMEGVRRRAGGRGGPDLRRQDRGLPLAARDGPGPPLGAPGTAARRGRTAARRPLDPGRRGGAARDGGRGRRPSAR